MTKNEYNDLEKRAMRGTTDAERGHILRVVSAALEIGRSYRKCDLDLVIAAAMTHEYKYADGREFVGAMFMWDDEKMLTLENCCAAIRAKDAPDLLEAKIVHDAHRLEECGVIAAARRLVGLSDIEAYTPTNAAMYDGYFTKLGGMMAKKRREEGIAFDNALLGDLDDLSDRLSENLDLTLRDEPIKNRLGLIKPDTGFAMDGYFVWCGSVIYASGEYHMFASRWRESLKFPEGYMVGSEIVHATSKKPEGPYTYKATVISQRQRGYWDAQFAHNPQVVKCGDTYVLFYNGAPYNDPKQRRIGYATTKNINGDRWVRCEKPIDLGREDCNNPSAWVERDGSIKLAFRYGNQRIGVAKARRFNENYEVINPDVMPNLVAEDPFLWRDSRTGMYRMIVEDGRGQLTGSERFGAILESDDAIHWQPEEPPLAYDHTLLYEDLSMVKAERRERPTLLFDKYGEISHLFTAVLYKGRTWNVCQPVNK